MVRNVKVARLPRLLRDELNRRLARNEKGATLLDWLNADPAVKDLLARDFAGEPISQQNLLEWRHGGFVEWQNRQDLFAVAADLTDANGEWDALAANDFTERLAAVVVVRYADALAGWNGGDDEAFRLKLRDLRRFNQDLAVLRRYNQTAARLKIEQITFYREEQHRAEAAASARKPSVPVAGARADDEPFAQRRRDAAALKLTCAVSEASAPSAALSPASPGALLAVSPPHTPARTAADQSIASVVARVIDIPGSTRPESGAGKELSSRDAAHGAPAGVQPDSRLSLGCLAKIRVKAGKTNGPEYSASSDQGPDADSPKSGVTPVADTSERAARPPAADQGNAGQPDAGTKMAVGADTLVANLFRANLVIEFADSLSNALNVIKEKSAHAFNLDDRRAVQSAYFGSVATVNRLGREAGLLRAELPGFADADRVSAAVEVLQQEYPRMKSNLFQGFSAAITVGIQQMRDAACDLRGTLQRKTAIGAAPAGRIP
jgi:hypothetical protein